jgi:DNA-binding transcriptional LysR family regulator
MDAGRADVPRAQRPDTRREPSPHQLRLFLVLAEEMHFGRAAARTFMTQPAFSQQIRALEDRIGVRLVDRSSRAVELTPAGQDLLPEIRGIVESVNRLRNLADSHAREVSGHLIIGSVGAEAAMPYTRALLDGLHARHPKVTVEIRLLNFVEHVRALAEGDVDAALVRPPVPPGIQLHHLATEPRVAVICSDDPLATGSSVTLARLAGRTVVDVPTEIPRVWWDFWAVDPRPDGSPVRYGPVVNDVEALLHVVATGKAMAFLPSAARELFPRPGVRYLDVTDLSPCTSALAWLPKNRNRPTIAALRQVAQTIR